MQYSITKRELAPQPVLLLHRRIEPSGIAQALGEMFGQVYSHVHRNRIALAGPPFARYLEMGPGQWTIEAGMPVAAPAPSGGDVVAGTLPGGSAAVTTHIGPYDQLHEAHAAIQKWIEAEGFTSAGAPWESYITDPGEHPDPKDWKTEVFCPVVAR